MRWAYFATFCFSFAASTAFAERILSPLLGANGWVTVTSIVAGSAFDYHKNVGRPFRTFSLDFIRHTQAAAARKVVKYLTTA